MAEENLPFPETIYVSHYDHSSPENPCLNACLAEKDAIDSETQPTPVAEYKLVKVRRLRLSVVEQP